MTQRLSLELELPQLQNCRCVDGPKLHDLFLSRPSCYLDGSDPFGFTPILTTVLAGNPGQPASRPPGALAPIGLIHRASTSELQEHVQLGISSQA